jgi:riboflavin synthase
MFTGLIRDRGEVQSVERRGDGARLAVLTQLAQELAIGDSLSTNGVCLTVEQIEGERVTVAAVEETMARSTLATLRRGQRVNLEPALRAGDAMGGHIVQGHVDGVATVESVAKRGLSNELSFALSPDLLRYVVEKGSIAVDGVSLTVARLSSQGCTVAVIPHTWETTTLSSLAAGQRVNIEVDILAKYVERMLTQRVGGAGQLTLERLQQLGY